MAEGAPDLKPFRDNADPLQEEGEQLLPSSASFCGVKRQLVFALRAQSDTSRSYRKDSPAASASPSPCNDTVFPPPASGDGGFIRYKRRKKSPEDSEKSLAMDDETMQDPSDPGAGGDNACDEKPARRFTRSALKVDDSKGSEAAMVNDKVLGSFENEDLTLEEAGNAVSAVKTSSKKKMELKMSKKIVLENIPTDVKELLATGLLEGLRVEYRFRGTKVGCLPGKVKDGGILCSCISCKGHKVITPFKFERHAGSSNRYAEQIYLENGNNLQHVLDACGSAPLNMLETIIQSAIGTSAVKEATVCLNCKGSFCPLQTETSPFFCKDCRVPKQSQASPRDAWSPTQDTSENNSLGKKRGRPKKLVSDDSLGKKRGCPKKLVSDNSLGKKRGRPKKLVIDNSVEKKRGRPKKLVIEKLERKRGRPKKLVSTSKDYLLEKKRGRPKKLVSTSKDSSMIKKRGRPKKLVSTSKDSSMEKKIGHPTKKLFSTSEDNSLEKKRGHQTKELFSTSKDNTGQKKGRITKKDLRLHKLVFMEDVLPDGTEVGYYSHGKKLLTGYKKGNGIFCCCCNSEVTPSQFEAHAGWARRRKPYQYIYTSNGVSLHELSISLSKGRKFSVHDNDDLCTICADGGNLLLCDGCPRAFHKDCAELSWIPQGDWYCLYCQRMFEREKFVECNDNAFAAGRVLGVDAIEQITKRCIRFVQTPEVDVTVCVLCRCHDFRKSGFGPRTVLLCDQCEKEYHVGCLKEHEMADLKELPKTKWFCCTSCSTIHAALEELLNRGFEKIPDSLSDVIKKKCEEKSLDDGNSFDIRWRLLSGKFASSDSRFLLSKAVTIFHDRFDPIIDSTSGKDLIPSMVYGRNTRDQEFGGMFCVVLTVNSTVVCAGILRIFGQEVAELPLVATSTEKEGQGFFQALFSCIESLLRSLKVRNLLLPAAEEAESIWTNRFGFKKVNQDELSKYTKDSRMMVFQGTSMLYKLISESQNPAVDPPQDS